MFKIKLFNNGASLEILDVGKMVYEFEDNKLEGLRNLLYDLCEQIQPPDGKYNKERIRIEIVHGSGYVCKDKNCSICKVLF